MKFSDLDISALLPRIFSDDEDIKAVLDVVSEDLRRIDALSKLISVYETLENQPDSALLHLAYEYSLLDLGEGWSESLTREQKIELIRSSISLHLKKGTRWAVEKALEIIGHNAELSEWFEYSGEPFCFRVIVDSESSTLTSDELITLTNYVKAYKNARSRLDTIEVNSIVSSPIYIAAALYDVDTTIVWPE